MKVFLSLFLLCSLLLLTTHAEAQKLTSGLTLDYTLNANFGATTLEAGFTPDPFIVAVTSGGSIDVDEFGSGCVGYASREPDYKLTWQGNSSMLRILFEAEANEEDASLIINTPDGRWVCNDDATIDTLNPMILFDSPSTGRYDIWVASYTAGDYIHGELKITELDIVPGSETSLSDESLLDFSLPPNFDTVSLSSGFTPDPYTLDILAGGNVDVDQAVSAHDCTGFASSAPDFRLNWTGSTDDLRIFFEADDPDDDTVLIIHTSNSEWLCNDDADDFTFDPLLNLHNYPAGQFDIWIATYDDEGFINGKLTITELDEYPESGGW